MALLTLLCMTIPAHSTPLRLHTVWALCSALQAPSPSATLPSRGTASWPALPEQEGGCHPVDGCQDGDPFYGAEFKFLAANVIRLQNGKTLFSAYKVRSFAGAKVAFIGIALESTPAIVTASGTAGVEFKDEAEVINAMVAEIKPDGTETIVAIVHAGTNACSNPTGSNLINDTDPEIDVFIMGHSHSRYACVVNDRVVSQAGSGGSYLTDIGLTIDRATGDVIASMVENVRITKAGVEKDPAMTALIGKY